MEDSSGKPAQFVPAPGMRQRTFQVLYELAVAMTGDRSLSENLQLVVDKSRELLGTETSHIALCDEPGHNVYMHTVSGIRTEAFKRIRLPFGKGLGGLVVKTRRGFIIDEYLIDERITRAVDDVVAAEGLVSGMAVPIQMGERNLGVLYVFNRRSTAFSQSDLDTLFPIANLAAVEISRKRVEETLRESEEKYRSVMEAVGEPIVVYDNEGKVLYLNPAFTRVFGWTLEEVIGKRTDFVPEENWPETRAALTDVFRDPDGYTSFESRRFAKSGDILDVLVSASVYRDRAGAPIGMIANLRDITARKRTEDALRESEEKYRSVMEASGEPLVVYDTEGRVIFFNPAFTRVFGWTLDELVGKRTDYTPEENRPETNIAIHKVFNTDEGYATFESRRFTKKGDILDVIISASVYRDRDGNALGMIANLRDITARKRAEEQLRKAHDDLEQRVAERTAELSQSNELLRKEVDERKRIEMALRESERRYRTLLDFVPYPIVVFDLNGCVSYLNPTFTEVFGWTLPELRSRRVPYVPSGLESETTELLRRLLTEKVLQHYETRRLTKDGNTLDVSMRAALFSESGDVPAGEIVILRDITEQKRIARNNEAMLRISMALPAHPDLEGLLDYVTGELKELLDAEGAAILLLDAQAQELYFASAAYDDAATQQRMKEVRFPLDETVAGQVIRSGEPLVAQDTGTDRQLYRERDKRLGYLTRSLLEVPLRSADRIIGVLCAVNKKKGAFDKKDVDLLTMMEATVALSIENARSGQELKNAYREVTSLNRAKDKAFHHLSHELKTPTSVLLTSLEILAKKLSALPEPSWQTTLERARRNLNRILEIQYQAEDIILDKEHKPYHLLSLLLDQCTDELEVLIADHVGEGAIVQRVRSRVEEIFGSKALEPQRVCVDEFARQRIEIMRPSFAHRHIEIVTSFESTPPVMIPLDPLIKLIEGLLKNAVENTPDGGKIEVVVRKNQTGTEIVVRDHGVGLTEETEAQVFQGFFTTQETMAYSSKKPFEFQAGGKGADLLRMKVFSERYDFTMRMESSRCTFILDKGDSCPGKITECLFCRSFQDCHESGGTTFFLCFPPASETPGEGSCAP